MRIGRATCRERAGIKGGGRNQQRKASWQESPSAQKTLSRYGVWLLNTARQFIKDELARKMPPSFARCANVVRYWLERQKPPPSHIARQARRATRGIWNTRQAAARAVRQPRSQRGWFRSPSESRHRGQYCGRPPIAALPDSSPATVCFPWMACCPWRKAWTRSAFSHIHQPICSCSGNQWDILIGRVENFVLGAPEPMPEVE